MERDGFPAESELVFNGINGATGSYITPPVKASQITELAKGFLQDREHLRDLEKRHQQSSTRFRGLREGIDPRDLSQAGWGIIFAQQDEEKTPAVREALAELLKLRRSQAGERFREFSGLSACRPGETKTEFLARHGVGPGPADPERVPYYLLIVAHPEAIPYSFQYQLDVQYAVGRIYFDDLEDYAHYTRSLVALEKGQATLDRRAVFFGVQNEADQATRLSATRLVQPLASRMLELQAESGWAVETLVGEAATKSALEDRLGGSNTPALLFTASHGMGFPKDDPRQLPHQGALLCQDWPGPLAWRNPIPQEFYFSGEDVVSDARLAGSVSFHFACYGAGTPRMDDYYQRAFREPLAIAPHAFIARLPQRLLAHPQGGQAAVIGHVERAWGYSFSWEKTESQLAVFESTLKRIMDGYPIGHALEYFNERYAELSTLLSSELQGARFGKIVDVLELAGMWTANNDARSYVILGDPAARLSLTQFLPVQSGRPENSRQSLPLADLQPSPFGIVSAKIDKITCQLQSLAEDAPERGERLFELGVAYSHLQGRDRPENLRAAIEALQAAAEFLTPERDAQNWIEIQGQLANQYLEMYAWSGEAEWARLAEQACRAVIAFPASSRASLAGAHLRLGNLFGWLFEHDRLEETASKALAAYQEGFTFLDRQSAPFSWASVQLEIARLEIGLYRISTQPYHRANASNALAATLDIFTPQVFPIQFAQVEELLREIQ